MPTIPTASASGPPKRKIHALSVKKLGPQSKQPKSDTFEQFIHLFQQSLKCLFLQSLDFLLCPLCQKIGVHPPVAHSCCDLLLYSGHDTFALNHLSESVFDGIQHFAFLQLGFFIVEGVIFYFEGSCLHLIHFGQSERPCSGIGAENVLYDSEKEDDAQENQQLSHLIFQLPPLYPKLYGFLLFLFVFQKFLLKPLVFQLLPFALLVKLEVELLQGFDLFFLFVPGDLS